MRLQELQNLIYSELNIIHNGFTYTDVCKYGGVFYKLKNKEIIGIRSIEGKLTISVK